jgi:hypothetical protein
MTEKQAAPQGPVPQNETVLDIGGLRFTVSFRGEAGATIRVYGEVDGTSTEMLRFDDFVEDPHYHVPAAAKPYSFDREKLGAPLPWFIGQIRDNLGGLLTDAGFAGVLDSVDLGAVSAGADKVEQAMIDCVPEGFSRVPGVGLQKV